MMNNGFLKFKFFLGSYLVAIITIIFYVYKNIQMGIKIIFRKI